MGKKNPFIFYPIFRLIIFNFLQIWNNLIATNIISGTHCFISCNGNLEKRLILSFQKNSFKRAFMEKCKYITGVSKRRLISQFFKRSWRIFSVTTLTLNTTKHSARS